MSEDEKHVNTIMSKMDASSKNRLTNGKFLVNQFNVILFTFNHPQVNASINIVSVDFVSNNKCMSYSSFASDDELPAGWLLWAWNSMVAVCASITPLNIIGLLNVNDPM